MTCDTLNEENVRVCASGQVYCLHKRAQPRGIFFVVPEDAILRDQRGRKVLNGAVAARNVKFDDQCREVEHKRFIGVLVPSNSYVRSLRGAALPPCNRSCVPAVSEVSSSLWKVVTCKVQSIGSLLPPAWQATSLGSTSRRPFANHRPVPNNLRRRSLPLVTRKRRDWLTAREMPVLFDVPPTCDDTNRAAGLSGWWSRRGLAVQKSDSDQSERWRWDVEDSMQARTHALVPHQTVTIDSPVTFSEVPPNLLTSESWHVALSGRHHAA